MVEFKEKDSKKEITVSDYPPGSKLIGEEGESNELKIFIDEYTLSEIDSSLSSDVSKELGGVLLGRVNLDASSNKFIVIDDIVIARYTDASVSRLTFTHDTWEYINNKIDDEHPDKIIIGWFHSHPGHSVFLSSYDIFIQENIFNNDFMTAYVFDPKIKERGFFFMKDGKVKKAKCYYVFSSPFKKNINADIDEISFKETKTNSEKKSSEQNNFKIKDVIIFVLLAANIILSLILLYNYGEVKKEAVNADDLKKKIGKLRNDNRELNNKLDAFITSIEVLDEKDSVSQESKNVVKYTVKEGDTLKKIALNFYKDETKYNLIVRHNKLNDEFDIFIGKVLEIPLIEKQNVNDK
jgi:proteasome lid subunit RPN8/RPN11/LysM repeat protein